MATFYFSNSSFESDNKGSKQKFKSNEYIYGRVELPKTIKEFFDTENGEGRDYPKDVLMFDIRVLNSEGTQLGAIYGKFIKPDQLDSKYLNFDISPEPSQATTLISMISDFRGGLSSVPSAALFDQSNYYGRVPDLVDGTTYSVEVTISRWVFDPYNPGIPESRDKWNTCSGKFDLEFNRKDIPALIKNNKAADELVKDNANKKAMANRGLPKEWNTWNGTNATGHTVQQLTAMFLNGKPAGAKIYKMVFEQKPSGPLWNLRKDGVIITERHCMQLVGVFAQIEGKCIFTKLGVRETYLGGDKYDIDNAWVQTIDRVDVDCKFIPETTTEPEEKAPKEKNAVKKKNAAKGKK